MGRSTDESAARSETAVSLRTQFESIQGQPPTVVAAAPGRVNLIGEHVDYTGGLVLPFAIDRHVVVAVERSETDHSSFRSEQDDAVAIIDHRAGAAIDRPIPQWVKYPMGVITLLAERDVDVPPIAMHVSSSLPISAGLSSSAALTIASATALLELVECQLSPIETARLCRDVEHRFLGTPCGLMDQLTVLHAKRGCAMLIDCATDSFEHVPLLAPNDAAVLIVNTNVRHELADGAYAARRARCDDACRALGLRSLRDANEAIILRANLDELVEHAALHVVTENDRTRRAAHALRQGDYAAIGRLLFAGHGSLRDRLGVSCPELDVVVECVHSRHEQESAIYGARMTGGGFGGCAIVLTHPDHLTTVRTAIHSTFLDQFGREPTFLSAETADGAGVLSFEK